MEGEYDFLDLEELQHIRSNIEERLERLIGDDNPFYRGDRGYQDALGDLEEIDEEIEKREMSKNNENKNLMNFKQFSFNEKKNLNKLKK